MESKLAVRQMELGEVDHILDYFYSSTPEHLETLGVDPTRFPNREKWEQYYGRDYALPIEQRTSFNLIWLSDENPIGFSTADTIRYGVEAKMHLHVTSAENRHHGVGAECVRLSVDLYFEALKLQRLICEPNALNVAPNRTLQKAGFKYVKTHYTVPGALNYHQAVTRWIIEG